MPSLIDEQTAYQGTDGKPLVNGSVYIGAQNQDPVSNLITIYSDRDLTTPLANPQTLNSFGRTANKIWVPGPYSLRVDNSAGVQQYQNLDVGSSEATGITALTNVQGTNTITAEGTNAAVTSLTDGQQYNFKAANANTGAVTLQIDLTAAKAIKKLHDVDLASGDIEANQVVSVVYNSTDDVFELVSNPSEAAFDNVNISGSIIFSGNTGGALLEIQVFTASGTWTKPAGCGAVEVIAVGGGGGASGTLATAAGTGCCGDAGGGGALSYKYITSGLGATETVTVGAGGAGATGGGNGSTGTASSFGAHVTANPGGPGSGPATGSIPIQSRMDMGNGGSIHASADWGIRGAMGDPGFLINTNVGRPARGGASGFAMNGGVAQNLGSIGNNGLDANSTAYGCGGNAPAAGNSQPAYNGGAGADGIVIVKAYSQ